MSTPNTPPESGGSDTVVMVGGEDWDQVVTRGRGGAAPANASWSTWARSTRRRTACCG